MATIPTNEPEEFRAGDTVVWDIASDDYPSSDGWTMKYRLSGPQQIDITGATSGVGYRLTITAAASADYGAGVYEFTGWVEKGAGATLEQHTIRTGRVRILQNLKQLVGDAAVESRTHWQIVLDAIEASQQGRATLAQSQTSINNRAISLLSPEELQKAWQFANSKVLEEKRRDRMRRGLPAGNRVTRRIVG